MIRKYCVRHGVRGYVFMLNHIFGKYGKLDFNNVIATFCEHAAMGKTIHVNN